MFKIDQKYQVFVFLVGLILLMTFIKFKYGYKGEPINTMVIPTPTIEVTPTINKDYPLQSKLPYQGKGFVIEKYTAPMTLNLKLSEATQQQAARDIGVWLDSLGDAGSGHVIELEEATPTAKLKK